MMSVVPNSSRLRHSRERCSTTSEKSTFTFPAAIATAADGLARHLSLLFVPAGVGVMLHLHRIADEWFAIVVALVVSTLLALAATAWTFQVLSRRMQADVARDQP